MSTGIKSDNSFLKIGKATIVADVGVDIKNQSDVAIDTYVFVKSDNQAASLIKLLKLPDEVPHDVLQEAVNELNETQSVACLEKSRLKAWLFENGYDSAFWAGLVIQFGTMLFGS